MRSGIVLAFVVAIVGSAPPAVAQVQPAYSEWSRVRRLEAGTEITVLRNRVGPSRRSFVRADDTELTVLNLTDPALPHAAVKVLRTMLANRPEYFVRQHTIVDGNIRIGPAGLFVADRKVADFGQIVEFIPRAEVAAIAGPAKTRGSWVGAGIGAGAGVLLGVGVFLGAINCTHTENCEGWPWRLTAPFWLPVALGVYAYQASGHEVGSVIYQAP